MEYVPLSTQECNMVANQDPILKKIFQGTFPCDGLPRPPKKNACYIVNTDPTGQPGQHWIALWLENQLIEVMDSYGLPLEWYRTTQPLIDWITTLDKRHWVTNGTTLQGLHSAACGHYCLAYLKLKARGGTLSDFLALFSDHDYVQNDQKVATILDPLPMPSTTFLNQCCQPREKVIKSVAW